MPINVSVDTLALFVASIKACILAIAEAISVTVRECARAIYTEAWGALVDARTASCLVSSN